MSANGPARDSRGRHDDVVVRKAERGWVVGEEQVSDLTSAMVLADLFAADQDEASYEERASGDAAIGAAATRPGLRPAGDGRAPVSAARAPRFLPSKDVEADEAARLAVTITQLEHALASRVRVEQAIGVLAERHRLRPREAFDLLRNAARSRGQRITEMAQDVVASTANPLLRLPEELTRKVPAAQPKQRRPIRRGRRVEQEQA